MRKFNVYKWHPGKGWVFVNTLWARSYREAVNKFAEKSEATLWDASGYLASRFDMNGEAYQVVESHP